MNIFVCIKQVPDTEATLSVKNGKTINEDSIKWIISPYDEHAIEEALKLKEKIPESNVTLITLGPKRCENALRGGLAMGADHAIHIETDEHMDNRTIAKALAIAIKQEGNYNLIFIGKQAIDNDSYLTHIYLAENLGIPVSTNVTLFNYESEKVFVEREIDGGEKEKIEMTTPCVIGAAKGLNTPRYPSLIGMMKAKKIPIKKLSLQDLEIGEIDNKIIVEKLFSPPEKPQGKIIEGDIEDAVKELVKALKDEAKVL